MRGTVRSRLRSMERVAAIIVAAGSSSRLGQPKQLLIIDGQTMLQRAIRFAHGAGASPVVVVLGAHRETIERNVDLGAAKIVVNKTWKEGIGGSIRVGVAAAENEASRPVGALLMICDQPRVTAEHLSRMMVAFRQQPESVI